MPSRALDQGRPRSGRTGLHKQAIAGGQIKLRGGFPGWQTTQGLFMFPEHATQQATARPTQATALGGLRFFADWVP